MLTDPPQAGSMGARGRSGPTAHARGVTAEDRACSALDADGWTVLARRLRTAAGEIDILAERDGVLAIIEVKGRRSLAAAAAALSDRQRARLLAAADLVLAEHPDWGANGIRFDLLLVDAAGRVRRIRDAFRDER
jgi:putative endonuclease